MSDGLNIAINAQIPPGRGFGGVEYVLVALVQALGQLDGPEQYTLITHWENADWLQPYIGPNQRTVPGPRPMERFGGSTPRALRPLAKRLHRMAVSFLGPEVLPRRPLVPVSDGFYEGLGCDVIHFPYQRFVICALPSIFNPHDLQHRHFPQFFGVEELLLRETIYTTACHHAHTVAVINEWVKGDVLRHYNPHPDKVQIIPLAVPSAPYPDPTPQKLAAVKAAYALPGVFMIYPAVTWPHKNHLRLLDALALLRDRGLRVNLICTGHQGEYYYDAIQPRLDALKLGEQVRFLGLVPAEDLRALYQLAQFLIHPTLFEASSSVIGEAWRDGLPVTCANVTALPDLVLDGAVLFDPYSVESMADAIRHMATDAHLRTTMHERGVRRLADFSWERSARAYRALYRRAAGRPLDAEEQHLLAWDWGRYPQREGE
ncbi:MAG: glycosyltransferase family 4 protein [Chloroflexi bacterium]|nr:glycosyltransferase family 4 protein [Chloroflexota bacterium]